MTHSLSFGLRTFLCTFILAAVSKPILGMDFLTKHRLLVYPTTGQVLDAESLSPIGSHRSATAEPARSPLAASLCSIAPAVRTLLAKFPAVVRRSNSPWSSPLHIVHKFDVSWRPCGDYCLLNLASKHDRYPLPSILDLSSKLHGCNFFSVIDLVKGYHKVPMAPADIEKRPSSRVWIV
jgi:hypothetical protein